ncbi:hypothetical protein V5O48_003809 [Marasmius crinis-equi]|uniref:Xylanolytic transcriptional activator regulatory domain-containing protein n=1 Tax=Marasmius crinis-equi TaxID=585013 RepID=A0ABR3FRT3_9AGAR
MDKRSYSCQAGRLASSNTPGSRDGRGLWHSFAGLQGSQSDQDLPFEMQKAPSIPENGLPTSVINLTPSTAHGLPSGFFFPPDGSETGHSHLQHSPNPPHSGYHYAPHPGYPTPSPAQQTETLPRFAPYTKNARRHHTQNTGDSNQTYNGSRVHNKRSSRSTSPTSSQDNLLTPRSPPTSIPSPEAIIADGKGKMKTQTPSQRYVSLLFECGLGYPLWRPTPRRTRAGEEYIINIGDVGVVRDGLPFYTLFNITQPKDSLANRDGVPEGVDPPCIVQPRSVTVDDKSDEKGKSYIRPKESILSENVQEDVDGSRVFNFTLTSTHGALLLLPRGSILETLEPGNEFTSRVQCHWHQWFDWAEQQGGLGDQRALYVVTGVEKCSAWAIAAWDSAADTENLQSLSLKLTVDGYDGGCSWAYSTARCETQSSARPTPSAEQTVFIRGFWINRYGGGNGSSPPPAPMDFGGDGGDDDGDNSGGDCHDDDHPRGNGRQQDHSSSSGNSSSRTTGRSSASFSGRGHSGGQYFLSLDLPQSDMRITNSSGSGSNSVTHPCTVINNLAFELISNIDPALLDAGCVVVSHDDDWMNIIRDSDGELPSEAEIIRRVSTELKYVVQGDTIYTSRMSNADTELIQQSLMSVQTATTPIPLLIEFRETEVEPEGVIQTATSASTTVSEAPLLPPSGASDDRNEEKISDALNPDPSFLHASETLLYQPSQFNTQRYTSLGDVFQRQTSQRAHSMFSAGDISSESPDFSSRSPSLWSFTEDTFIRDRMSDISTPNTSPALSVFHGFTPGTSPAPVFHGFIPNTSPAPSVLRGSPSRGLLAEMRKQAETIEKLTAKLAEAEAKSPLAALDAGADPRSPASLLGMVTEEPSDVMNVEKEVSKNWVDKELDSFAPFGGLLERARELSIVSQEGSEDVCIGGEDTGEEEKEGEGGLTAENVRGHGRASSANPPNANAADGQDRAVTNADFLESARLPDPKETQAYFKSQTPDPLKSGIITQAEAIELFNLFFTTMNLSVSLIDPVLYTPQRTLHRSPLLFTVICTIASRFYTRKSELYSQLVRQAQDIAGTICFTGQKNVEMSMAFVLMSLYPAPFEHFEDSRSCMYLEIAIRIATELNLCLPPTVKPLNEVHAREQLNRTRVWINCFNLDRSMSSQYGRRPIISSGDYISNHVERWWSLSDYNIKNFDIHTCCYSAELNVVGKFIERIYSDPNHPTGLSRKLDFEEVAITTDEELQRLKGIWWPILDANVDMQDSQGVFRMGLLRLTNSYSRLIALSYGFHYGSGKHNVQSKHSLLMRCISAARDAITAVVDYNNREAFWIYVRHGPDAQSVFVTFAATFLIKLLKPKFTVHINDVLRDDIRKLITSVIDYLGSPQVGIDGRHSPKEYAKFLKNLLSRR